ncbi:MAG: glutamate--tRNA ligase [Holosporales bacterium]|nr:glutamate--tRNA ligase [Holosporales bacterium]
MSVVVRFAPSPTGVLHIGSVRTALFNWLFARHHGGKFLLRIEDTDRLRSTAENARSILEILNWLELDWDGEPVVQSSRIERHKEVANELVRSGKAFYCTCSPEELAVKKEAAIKAGKSHKYDGKCREQVVRPFENAVIRLRAETCGVTILDDLVQERVSTENAQLDDLVLLRSDETPTYMLSVVVDDHDMGVTHVLRGDDHLTNTFRQIQIYKACGWDIPQFGHIPLIYGPDGAKLSKRHGAASAQDYMQLGYLPEAIFNYLLRLGWSHGDSEIISRSEAVEWFDITGVGKSPARFDMAKLQNLNAHYMKMKDDQAIFECMSPFLETEESITDSQKNDILRGMKSLKGRSRTLVDLAESAKIYISAPKVFDDACSKYATNEHLSLLQDFVNIVEAADNLQESSMLEATKILASERSVKLVEIAQAVRGALCGKLASPSVFEIIEIIGKSETIARVRSFIKKYSTI